jgi:hypothetical protein
MSSTSRRNFLWTSGAVVGAALFQSMALPSAAIARGGRIWQSADILIGQSPSDQVPGLVITCPMYLSNGAPTDASHTLDLSGLPSGGPVTGDISWGGDSISPDFGPSTAAEIATGSDGKDYLLVGSEGAVSGGEGHFRHVTRVAVRCKYKVAVSGGFPLLIACLDCVAILIRD